MHCADAGTRQHGINRFGDHRHIDGDSVAFLGAPVLQHVGESADLVIQSAISDVFVIGRFVTLPDNRDIVPAFGQVPVDTVDRRIQGAVLKPVDRYLTLKTGILDLAERFYPVNAQGLFCPEGLRHPDRALIHLKIFFIGAMGTFKRMCGYRKTQTFTHF